jgi:hypothetical protein
LITAPTKAEVRELLYIGQSKLSDVTLAEGADQEVLTWHVSNTAASGISTLDGWLTAKEPVKMGGHGPGGVTSDTARILRDALGVPLRVVDGYKCTGPIRLAAESGEVSGGCWAWESMKPTWSQGFESGQVKVVVSG